jgi:predicted nucleotidyltransferase component of viral defense system
MGRGKQEPGGSGPEPRNRAARLPKEVRDALTPAVARAWRLIAPHLPDGLYLAGGTATALRLHHRRSNDLDFFFHDNSVDLDTLEAALSKIGAAVDLRSPGTLRVYVGDTKIEFFHADEARQQHQLAAPSTIGDVPVADIRDLMAMKLKVLAERGELRDYYDVKEIEEREGVSIEDGIALFRERYRLDQASPAIRQLIMALGYLDDCDEDESLPMSKSELADWWRKRHARLIRNLGR